MSNLSIDSYNVWLWTDEWSEARLACMCVCIRCSIGLIRVIRLFFFSPSFPLLSLPFPSHSHPLSLSVPLSPCLFSRHSVQVCQCILDWWNESNIDSIQLNVLKGVQSIWTVLLHIGQEPNVSDNRSRLIKCWPWSMSVKISHRQRIIILDEKN